MLSGGGRFRPYSRRGSEMRPVPPVIDYEFTGQPDLPAVPENLLLAVKRENETRTIEIDSTIRETRNYGENVIVFLDWNDPRRVTFEKGAPCKIVFDNEFTMQMHTGDNYRDLKIDGIMHRIKLGAPNQELLIDEKGYQCFFGGKEISVHLAKKDRSIKLDGKPPKVDIGKIKNYDYVAGKIELIINAKKMVPLFLDAKPQKFTIDGIPFIIQFLNSLKSVAINGVEFPIEFGGLPFSISVRGYRKYLRFSELPPDVIPGNIKIKGMGTSGVPLIPKYPSSPPPMNQVPPVMPPSQAITVNPTGGVPPQLLSGKNQQLLPPRLHPPPNILNTIPTQTLPLGPPMMRPRPPVPLAVDSPFTREGHPIYKTPPTSMLQSRPFAPIRNVVPGYLTTGGQLNVPSHSANLPITQPPPDQNVSAPPTSKPMDVQSLLNTLVKSGIIGVPKGPKEAPKVKQQSAKESTEIDEDEDEEIDDLKDVPSIEYMFKLHNLRK